MNSAQVALVPSSKNPPAADVLTRLHRLAGSTSRLRHVLASMLELPSIEHAKTEDLAQLRALLEMCASQAVDVDENVSDLSDLVGSAGRYSGAVKRAA